MAQRGIQLDVETFSCSICLELLKNPVAIPCGHSYCMSCIQNYWYEGGKKKSSCPQCRRTFPRRPALVKNTMLAAVVEQLKQTELQVASAVDRSCAEAEDVACDVCTGSKTKAIKSCLVCLASYCEEHLQPHRDAAALQKHKLAEPSAKLLDNICSRHDEAKKVFCRTDQQCICLLCTMDEHTGHQTVPVAIERVEKQKELEERRQQIQQRIQEREKDVNRLRQQAQAVGVSADEAVEDAERIFAELTGLIQRRSSDVKQQIRDLQEHQVSRVRELQERLEEEIAELKRREAELGRLESTEDHNQFLQSFASLPALVQSAHASSLGDGPLMRFEDVTAAVSELRDKLLDALGDTGASAPQTVPDADVLPSGSHSEPKSRAEFLKYACDITLDPNTAFRTLLLSKENRAAMVGYVDESYTPSPERFSSCRQALSRESLTGRCYFEFKWAGIGLIVALAYNSVERAGRFSLFGNNDQSWALRCDIKHLSFNRSGYIFSHNKVETSVSGPQSWKIGVYLDHSAGLLSFYDVSDTMTLLHRVQTTFTQPLHAGLCFYWCDGGDAEFCDLKKTE